MLVEVKDRNGLFRSKLPFGDSLPAFLIAAPETSHAPFAFLPGGYSWWANLTNAYDGVRIKSIAIRTHTSIRAHWSAPIKLASRQPPDTNPWKCGMKVARPFRTSGSLCSLLHIDLIQARYRDPPKLPTKSSRIWDKARALIIHGTGSGMKPARRIPGTMLIARPGTKAVVSAGIEREPKRTVPNDLGCTSTVSLLLSLFFMGFSFVELKLEPVDLDGHY